MKGDRAKTVIDAGNTTRTYEVVASRAGRRVETALRRGVVEVSEVTRWGSLHVFKALQGSGGGSVVRTARFMATGVLALVEQQFAREDSSEQTGRPLRETPET